MNHKCSWLSGRKTDGFSDLQVLVDGKWVSSTNVKIYKKKFVKSPFGIIPLNSYSGDKHSKQCLEWLTVLKRNWITEGK